MNDPMCQYPPCGRPIQVTPGHRPRLYCDDTCRVAAFRWRQEQAEREKHRAALRAEFGGYEDATLALLDIITQVASGELAHRVAWAINAEAGKQVHASREAATRKVFELQKQVKELEQERTGLREKQQGRVDKMKIKAAGDKHELEQARADLTRQYQERAREQEEFHKVYEAARDMQTQLRAARNRIAELVEMQHSQPVEQNVQECQQKLSQAGQRITKLEGQVAIQRERLGQHYQQVAHLEQELATYRQIIDLSDRARLERQLYDIGEQIGYRQFIPSERAFAVGHGVECWQAFTENASDEELAQAIVRVKYFAENLIAVDAQAEVQRLRSRIRELEKN